MPDSSRTKATLCPQTIRDLIERFELHRETYQRETYNETQVRREFIDPFFKSLGWDVDNESGHAEAYKDVIHEDAIKVGGSTKAPDYCFRIGGARKFFVEAKKPSVSVGDDPGPAYQLRRYAWTNKLPLSIVTDFEELAVYDCRIKPKPDDKPSTARVLYLKCDEYSKRWDEIASIFSKDSILKGSFDKYAESNKRKRGTTEVDDEFLKEIESWRDELARSIALRNPNLSVRDLNYAVGKTIDRIIFLRMCEDRGVETYAQLRLLLNGPRVYPRLLEIFYRADQRYNSGLFHFEPEKNRPDPPDNLTPNLTVDDAVLKSIIKNLYYPECPYEFSVMPPEILGQVYEQFLGKVITLTAGHRAKVEYKPEVKKAGGVYYTPKYIVDYIVAHTLGTLLAECKTPNDAAKLRILDPACGSGSFLLGAYQVLLDWRLKWYSEHEPEKWARKRTPPIYQSTNGNRQSTIPGWRLTITEKKRVLLGNVYGVDIDPQAVEVTKLSLLLKVLEGESQQTLDNQFRLFHERALPDLGGNIKCGNSLIGPDFFNGHQLKLFDDAERYRVNIFDWHAEFPEIMGPPPDPRNPSPQSPNPKFGFDAVIGNPPYVRIQTMQEFAPQEVEFIKKAYRSASQGNYDIYVVFVERGLSLLRRDGVLGFITPHKFFNAKYGQPLRSLIADGRHLSHAVHFTDQQVFKGATTYTCLLFLDKLPAPSCHFVRIDNLDEWLATGRVDDGDIPAKRITGSDWNFTVGANVRLLEKLRGFPTKLVDCAEKVYQGLATSADSVYVLEGRRSRARHSTLVSHSLDGIKVTIESAILRPLLKGSDIHRYKPPTSNYLVVFPYHVQEVTATPIPLNDLKRLYPMAYGYLSQNKRALIERSKTNVTNWWLFPYPKNLGLYAKPKILSQVLSTRGNFALDLAGEVCFLGGGTAGGNAIRVKADDPAEMKCMLGILNSRLTTYWVARTGSAFRSAFFAFGKASLAPLPIPRGISGHLKDDTRFDSMIQLVDRILDLHKRLETVRNPSDQTAIQRQIDATDRQIDQLVYELYGLTDDEIRVVEESTRS